MLYLALASSLGIGMVAITSKEVSYFDEKFQLQKLDIFKKYKPKTHAMKRIFLYSTGQSLFYLLPTTYIIV